MTAAAWPLQDTVVSQELLFNLFDHLYQGEGVMHEDDLLVTPIVPSASEAGIGVKIAPGGAIINYEGLGAISGGKRVFFSTAEEKSGANEFPNPDFNPAGTPHWSVIGAATLTRDAGTFHSSPASGKIATSGASSFTQGIKNANASIRVDPSMHQEVSCWFNAPVGTTVRLKVTEYTAAGAVIGVEQRNEAGIGVWSKITVPAWITAPNCQFINTEILISSAGSVNVFVDDFTLLKSFYWIVGFGVADTVNPRVDRVVVIISDESIDEGFPSAARFAVIGGIPFPGATLANLVGALPIPSNSYLLANVLVPANATSLTAAEVDSSVRDVVGLNVPGIERVSVANFPPTNPDDGQIITLVVSSLVEWLLRYDANIGYWKFIGGPPIPALVVAEVTRMSASYGDLSGSIGPDITVPFTGDYYVEVNFQAQPAGNTFSGMSFSVNGDTNYDIRQAIGYASVGAVNGNAKSFMSGLQAGDLLRAKYTSGSGSIGTAFQERLMQLIPFRLAG